MLRPGYLGNLSDTWLGDSDKKFKPFKQLLKARQKNKRQAGKQKTSKPPRPKKPSRTTKPESVKKPTKSKTGPDKKSKVELPAKASPIAESAVQDAQQYTDMVIIPGYGPVPASAVEAIKAQQAAAKQAVEAAKAQASPQQLVMLPQPMMPMPQTRVVRPSTAQPIQRPFVTPQMERIGKIAAAIGAGLFFL
jgi:Predicted membrane protein